MEVALFVVTDFSQGHEMTSEWGVKLGVGIRLPTDIAGIKPGQPFRLFHPAPRGVRICYGEVGTNERLL